MNFGGFLAYCILLTGFWGQIYWVAHTHFNDSRDLKKALKNEIVKNFQLQLAYDILAEKKHHILPAHPSVSRGVASVFNVTNAYKEAKVAFDSQDYASSLKLFNKIVDSGMDSPYTVQTYLLKAEAEYRIGEKENAVMTIKKMMRLYPDKEYTGYALLKLAKIYQDQKMTEEAIDTYKVIIRTFVKKDLVEDARRKLGTLEP